MNPPNAMRIVLALLAAVCTATLSGLLIAALAGGASPVIAAISLALGAGAGVFCWLRVQPPAGERPKGWIAGALLTCFALFALRGFCWVVFERGDSLSFLSRNNLGDLSYHFTLIRALANGIPFWPVNPIFSGGGLHYPFGMDWLNSLLLLVGLDLYRGMIWTGLIGSAATAVMLWRWGGSFALAGFLFNGGFAAWTLLHGTTVAELPDLVAWKSIPLAMFITQRTWLYAIPATLALLWSWRERFFRERPGLPLLLEIALYATMPFFSLHTFLFLSWLLGAWGLLALLERRREWLRQLCTLVGGAVIPASVLVWFLTGGFAAGQALHLKPGWMQGESSALSFWTLNFGILPLLIVALLVSLRLRRGPREDVAFAVPAVALALVACFVMFAAWEWDNTKLFLWCYLALLPPLWRMLKRWPLLLRAACCVLLFTSGAITLVEGLSGNGYELAKRPELAAIEEATRDLPPQTTFAGWPTFNHPLLLLGRPMVMGYDGHLFSHGIDYLRHREQLEVLMRGDPGWREAAREVGAEVIFWGHRERTAYGQAVATNQAETTEAPPAPAWQGELPVLASGDWGTLYDLREPPRP